MGFMSLFLLAALIFLGVEAFKPTRNGARRRFVRVEAVSTDFLSKINAGKDLAIAIDDSGVAVAARDIPEGEVIFSVPIGECMEVGKAKQALSWLGEKATKSLRTGDFGLLALYLLQEMSAGSGSKYAEYLGNLPANAPGVLGWSADLLEEYMQSTTRDVAGQIAAIQNDWYIVEAATKASKDKVLIRDDLLSLEAFTRAFGLVKAYNLYIEGEPVLAPGIEAIQTETYAESEAVLDSAGMWGGKLIKLVARGESFSKGDEIIMNSGFRSAAECVEDLGTCPDLDVEDCTCEITARIDGENEATWDMYWQDKLNVLEAVEVRPSNKFDLEADDSVEFDPAMIQFLRLKLVRGQDSFILESIFAPTAYETMAEPFSKENEKAVFEFLLTSAEACLAKLNKVSDAASDKAVIESGSGDDKKAMLAMLREHERAALESSRTKAQTMIRILDAADTNEYYQERRLREMDLLRPLEEDEIVP